MADPTDYETEREKLRRKSCPDALLRLAQQDPLVQACVQMWRHGDFPWEGMLVYAIGLLVERNQKLIREMVKGEWAPKPSKLTVIESGIDPTHQVLRCDHCKGVFGLGLELGSEIRTCDEKGPLTLCESCYAKAGNNVR